jgi:hypothetical protein
VFGVITYALCYLWNVLAHTAFTDGAFTAAFPGFSWSTVGFAIGLGWTVMYSVYTGILFSGAYNLFGRTAVEPRTRPHQTTQ